MTKIICKLFGYPKIYEDKKEIFFKYIFVKIITGTIHKSKIKGKA